MGAAVLFLCNRKFLGIPYDDKKGTNVPMMRTRAKQKHVASDRARRENVPRHILFYFTDNPRL